MARPDRQTQRYDRQLRLWHRKGQTALEQAHVLVVGATPLAGQIVKNLALPGLGACTLWDDRVVSADAARSDFFLTDDSVGRPYVTELKRSIGLLNPATELHAVAEPPAALLAKAPEFLAQFSLVVCVRLPRRLSESLASVAWHAAPPVPLIWAQSSGFVGEMSISLGELGIVETHPASVVDLRLTRPFPALAAYAAAYEVDSTDAVAQSHVPFVVLLLQALETWKAQHDGELPTRSSRDEFVALIESQRPDGSDPENVHEALAALAQHVWRPLQAPPVPAAVSALFNDAACRQLTPTTSPFWLMVAALRAFVEDRGVLPLSGALPDMKATSAHYVKLQAVYRDQARADLARFEQLLDAAAAQAHVSRSDVADDDTVRSFVKHAAFLQLVRGRPLHLQRTEPNVGALAAAMDDPVNPITAPYHIALLAAEQLAEKLGRYPGQSPDAWDADVTAVVDEATAYARALGVPLGDDAALWQRVCQEVVRGAHSDTPSTAALLGGLVAQEAIKVLTVQYLPLDNTCVYDGTAQALGSFRL